MVESDSRPLAAARLGIGAALVAILLTPTGARAHFLVPFTFGCHLLEVCDLPEPTPPVQVICSPPSGTACCGNEPGCPGPNQCSVSEGFHDSSLDLSSFQAASAHCCTERQRPCDDGFELDNEVAANGLPIPPATRCLRYAEGVGLLAAESDAGPGCTFYCGDGFLNRPGNDLASGTEDDEECDDGNRLDGDGCDPGCTVTPAVTSRWVASGDPLPGGGGQVQAVRWLSLDNDGGGPALVMISPGGVQALLRISAGGVADASAKVGDPVPGRPGTIYSSFSTDALPGPIAKAGGNDVTGCRVDFQQVCSFCRPYGGGLSLLPGDPLPANGPGVDPLLQDILGARAANPVAFVAQLHIGSAGVTAADDTALFLDRETGTGPEPVMREGGIAPGLPAGALLADLSSSVPSVAQGGWLALRADLIPGVGGVTTPNDSVLYRGKAPALEVLAREGDPAPGTTGIFAAVPALPAGPALNARGDLALAATLTLGVGGVTSADAAGVWKTSGAGLQLVARAGDPAPGTPPGVVFGSFGNVVLNDAGAAAFLAHLAGTGVLAGIDDVGIWSESQSTALELVARAGNPAPGGPGLAFGVPFVAGPSLNGVGQVLLHGFLALGLGGVTAQDDGAVWLTDAAGALEELFREGDVLELAPGDPVTVASLTLGGAPASGGSDGRPRSLNDRGQASIVTDFSDGRSAAWVVSLPSPCGPDADGDSICDDGDGSGTPGDAPCAAGATTGCDDNCGVAANPLQEDGDGDGRGDFCDSCPFFATADLSDTDADGRGDACECSDQNGDGRNTVSDLVAINYAIFNPLLVTPLCDGNGDGLCNVNDIIAANVEIFSPTNTSTCSRQPEPGP